jgi:hypothetical protein
MSLRPCRLALSRALLGTLLPGALVAQADRSGRASGAVRGEVYDSTAHEPLANAAVFLWNTPHRAVTDSAGRFLMTDIPGGEYSILFFHTRLGEMGISPGPQTLTIRPGDTVEVALATPSIFTSVVSTCLYADRTPGTGAVAGWVGDGESGMGLPGAEVSLSWTLPTGGPPQRLYLDADAGGWYHTCEAPAEIPITASARFLDRQGLRREVTVPEGGSTEVGFLLWRLGPSAVGGRIVDASTDHPVEGAEVWLRGTSFRSVTGSRGEFRLGSVPPGTYMLFARHLAYGTKQDTLEVPSEQTLRVDMRVDTRAIEMEPLTVTVESRPLTQRAMGGLVIDRADIEEVRTRVRDAVDILQAQHLPGIIVRRRSDGSTCVGYMPGQVRMMFNSGCVPMVVFINDVRATNADMALQLPPDAIDRIVLYRPVEAGNLYGLGSGNGILAIYTRNR